jgi:hypothetical protein
MLLRSLLLTVVLLAAGSEAVADDAPGRVGSSAMGFYPPGYSAAGFYTGYYGYRHSWDYFPYGRFDYGLNYYGTAPTTSAYMAYYPAPLPPTAQGPRADGNASAASHVRSNPSLWLDGQRTVQVSRAAR